MLVAVRKVIIHYLVTKRVDLAVHDIFPTHPMSRQRETSNAIKQVTTIHIFFFTTCNGAGGG
jgi:hypothetical protein